MQEEKRLFTEKFYFDGFILTEKSAARVTQKTFFIEKAAGGRGKISKSLTEYTLIPILRSKMSAGSVREWIFQRRVYPAAP